MRENRSKFEQFDSTARLFSKEIAPVYRAITGTDATAEDIYNDCLDLFDSLVATPIERGDEVSSGLGAGVLYLTVDGTDLGELEELVNDDGEDVLVLGLRVERVVMSPEERLETEGICGAIDEVLALQGSGFTIDEATDLIGAKKRIKG